MLEKLDEAELNQKLQLNHLNQGLAAEVNQKRKPI